MDNENTLAKLVSANNITLKKLQNWKKIFQIKLAAPLIRPLDYREGEMMSVDVDNSRLVNLGWMPVISLKKGLEKIVQEIK